MPWVKHYEQTKLSTSAVASILSIVATMMVTSCTKQLPEETTDSSVADSNTNLVEAQSSDTRFVANRALSEDEFIGLWGGKWDDTWPIFLLIQSTPESNGYEVRYQWLENFSDAALSTRDIIGYKTNNYLTAKFLIFQATGTNGMLYGNFKRPRMANLVRLDLSDHPSSESADELLAKHGWSENAIPAREALRTITKPVLENIGGDNGNPHKE